MSEQNGTTTEPMGPEPIPSVNGEPLPPAAADASETLRKVNAALTAFGKACRTAADHNYLIGAAGLAYADLYLSASAAAKYDAALDNLADEAAKWSEDSLTTPLSKLRPRYRDRVGRLIRVSAAVRCLTGSGDAPKLAKGKGSIPWGQAREMLPLLADGERGQFFIPEGVRDKAAHLWDDVKAGSLSREEIGAAATEIMALHRAAETAAAQTARENAAAEQRKADKEAADRKAEEDKAAAQAEAASKAADAASGPDKVDLTAQAEAARAELATAQEAASAAVDDAAEKAAALARAEEEERNRVKAQVEADARAKARKDAADKVNKGKAKDAPPADPVAPPAGGGVVVKPGAPIPTDPRPPEPASGNVFGNLAKMAKRGAPKDVAEGIASAIRAADDSAALLCETLACFTTSDDALRTLLMALEGGANISAKGKRAVAAALTVLDHKGRGGIDPSVNGAPATAGAA